MKRDIDKIILLLNILEFKATVCVFFGLLYSPRFYFFLPLRNECNERNLVWENQVIFECSLPFGNRFDFQFLYWLGEVIYMIMKLVFFHPIYIFSFSWFLFITSWFILFICSCWLSLPFCNRHFAFFWDWIRDIPPKFY